MSNQTQATLLERYIWLYNTISSCQPINFEGISKYWQKSSLNDSHQRLPHKTFENHKKAIEQIFHIKVSYLPKIGYKIVHTDKTQKEVLKMFNNSFTLNNISSNPSMEGKISFEPIEECAEFLSTIADAIEERYSLWITYRHNYEISREETIEVKPIGIKQFRQRWYLVAELQTQKIYSFPLDRIISIGIGKETIIPDRILSDIFRDNFGIMREADKPIVDILLKVEHEQARYFKRLPLHHSQQIKEDNEDFTIFSLNLSPTYDFIMELLSHGERVEVLAPISLRNEMRNRATNLMKLYTK